MAASPFAVHSVVGVLSPQSIGQFRCPVVDVVWTSDGANETADASLTPRSVGLTHIIGAIFLADSGDFFASSDSVGTVDIDLDSSVAGTGLNVTARDNAGSALDLDATDVAAARLMIVGY